VSCSSPSDRPSSVIIGMSSPDATPARGRTTLDDTADVRELTGKTPSIHTRPHNTSITLSASKGKGIEGLKNGREREWGTEGLREKKKGGEGRGGRGTG